MIFPPSLGLNFGFADYAEENRGTLWRNKRKEPDKENAANSNGETYPPDDKIIIELIKMYQQKNQNSFVLSEVLSFIEDKQIKKDYPLTPNKRTKQGEKIKHYSRDARDFISQYLNPPIQIFSVDETEKEFVYSFFKHNK